MHSISSTLHVTCCYFPTLICNTLVTRHFQGGTLKVVKTKGLLANCTSNNNNNPNIDACFSVQQRCENQDLEGGGNEIKDRIGYIKWMLNTIGDGRISFSAYDTAWVALIPNDANSGSELTSSPLFPTTLEWIVKNQVSDGSWGEPCIFSAYDRLLNTLACVVALTTWSIYSEKTEKGIRFIKENMYKLESTDAENMTCGFEVVFPALLEKAQILGIELPYDSPALKEIYDRKALKMTRIPKEFVHAVPTSLLFSLEGLEDLDWEKLLKLQTPLGSFLTSLSSTAFAAMETKDDKCLNFLQEIVAKFDGGVPPSYPVDLFARLFAVDRLQRLGISHYFQPEINKCLDYVNRYWNENGIFSGRYARFSDLDDTSMGFRLLRLHGYNVTPEVFRNFKDDDEFCCYPAQINESPSPIFNLYRASQLLFPGEKILEDAKKFSYNFLKGRLDTNQLLDKWLIPKDLAGEVRYGLEVPWYASLPRIETRFYIQHYGGANDIWIGKTLYRMPDINNNVYLDLARSDFNKCQALHQMEWKYMLKWHEKCDLQQFGISENFVQLAYFQAAANTFEVEKTIERVAWAKSLVLSEAIKSYSLAEAITLEQRMSLINGQPNFNGNKKMQSLQGILVDFVDQVSVDTFKWNGRDIRQQLQDAWEMWGTGVNGEAELLVRTINLCGGYVHSPEIFSKAEYKCLSDLTNKICHKLEVLHDMEIESEFQKLVELVLQNSSDGITEDIKQTFLLVAKTFYYTAYCSQETIHMHISKVLFEPIL